MWSYMVGRVYEELVTICGDTGKSLIEPSDIAVRGGLGQETVGLALVVLAQERPLLFDAVLYPDGRIAGITGLTAAGRRVADGVLAFGEGGSSSIEPVVPAGGGGSRRGVLFRRGLMRVVAGATIAAIIKVIDRLPID